MIDGASCSKCVFFQPVAGQQGECRCGSPDPIMVNAGHGDRYSVLWPSIPADAWCGRFKAPTPPAKS